MILKCCLTRLKCFFKALSSCLINFVRSRDPVGEKTTKIGAAAFGRRPPLQVPILVVFSPTGSLERTKLIRLLLKSLKNHFKLIKQHFKIIAKYFKLINQHFQLIKQISKSLKHHLHIQGGHFLKMVLNFVLILNSEST